MKNDNHRWYQKVRQAMSEMLMGFSRLSTWTVFITSRFDAFWIWIKITVQIRIWLIMMPRYSRIFVNENKLEDIETHEVLVRSYASSKFSIIPLTSSRVPFNRILFFATIFWTLSFDLRYIEDFIHKTRFNCLI
jgi:hypothetical protein